jgi:hypothetical protein
MRGTTSSIRILLDDNVPIYFGPLRHPHEIVQVTEDAERGEQPASA